MKLQYAAEYRGAARNMLRGRWGQAVLAGLVAMILGGTSDSGSSVTLTQSFSSADSYDQFGSSAGAITGAAVGVGVLLTILFLLIGCVVRVGYCRYNMKLVNGQETRIGDLFSPLNRFGTCFVMNLIKAVLILIGTFLLIVPGIILTYAYAMAPYILAEHPDYTATQALRESRMMMKGHKWRFFCLQISFIGWSILAALTCGIGLLWLTPYIEAASAIFYLELAGDYYGSTIY